MKKLFLTLTFLSLSACSTVTDLFTPLNQQYPDMPTNIAGIELVLTATETGALAYTNQHLCGSPKATKICSDINIVRNIKDKKQKAEIALAAAKASEDSTSIGAAINAVGAFKQIVSVVRPTGE